MNEQQMVDELVGAANGNLHLALFLAVRRIAMAGACVSAGFVRCNPYTDPDLHQEDVRNGVEETVQDDRRATG